MNNVFSFCGVTDARIRASEKVLPVEFLHLGWELTYLNSKSKHRQCKNESCTADFLIDFSAKSRRQYYSQSGYWVFNFSKLVKFMTKNEHTKKDFVAHFFCFKNMVTIRDYGKFETFGLGQTNWVEAFGVFLPKLLALFWHCESLVHGKMYLVSLSTKNFGF